MFPPNEGDFDRGIRIFVGFALLLTGLVVGGNAGLIIAGLGLIPILTGAIGWCPFYSLFHIDTCHKT
jgi:hypothetical protein